MAITTKNKIRVTLVNSLRVNNLRGGTEKVFFEMANYLTANGYFVDAITMDFIEGQPVFRYSNDVNYKNLCTNKFKPLWIFFYLRWLGFSPPYHPQRKIYVRDVGNYSNYF